MYLNNVTACIKVNGQILRESGDLVTLPWGSEYSIFLKNLNSVRTQVSISVDGVDATEDTKLVIAPNSSLELERFIKDGNLSVGNRFRFIERSAEIEAHRGIGSDDGLVRVEAWREIVTQRMPVPRVEYYDDPYPVPVPRPYPVYPKRPWHIPMRGASSPLRGATSGRLGSLTGHPTSSASLGRMGQSRSGEIRGQSANSTKSARRETERRLDVSEQSLSDVGITVPGSESRQQFTSVAGFPLETQSTVIILRLRGQVGVVPVVTPVTVKSKPKCSSCGKVNRGGTEFCGKCGTALVVYA